jgi:hypothetical protein
MRVPIISDIKKSRANYDKAFDKIESDDTQGYVELLKDSNHPINPCEKKWGLTHSNDVTGEELTITPFSAAADVNNVEIMKASIDHLLGSENGFKGCENSIKTAMKLAIVEHRNPEMVKLLLQDEIPHPNGNAKEYFSEVTNIRFNKNVEAITNSLMERFKNEFVGNKDELAKEAVKVGNMPILLRFLQNGSSSEDIDKNLYKQKSPFYLAEECDRNPTDIEFGSFDENGITKHICLMGQQAAGTSNDKATSTEAENSLDGNNTAIAVEEVKVCTSGDGSPCMTANDPIV